MKRIFSLTVICCLLLSACGSQPSETTETTVSPETSSTTLPVEETAAPVLNERTPLICASLPAETQHIQADDGTVIFSYTCQDLSLIHPKQDVADAVIVDYLNRMDQHNTVSAEISDQAQNDYNDGSDWVPYRYSVLFSPVRIDMGVLSLYGQVIRYTGGIHPEYSGVCANYDMQTGDVLTLASVLTGSEKAVDVAELAVDILTAQKENLELFTGFETLVRQTITADPTQNENWYFTSTGLCFYFPPYEIAPYSSGTITAEIPYDRLTGLLYDGYFPAEQDLTSGIPKAERLTGNLGTEALSFKQMAEVILDEGGEQIAIYTDGKLLEVRLDVGSWDADGTIFMPEYTAFSSESLCQDDAILIEASIPDTMPTLRFRYCSGNEEHFVYISQSGEDGSILLLDK